MKIKRFRSVIFGPHHPPKNKHKDKESIIANSPPLQPKEHLAVLDALSCVRSQLHQTEQADSALCRSIESAGSKFFIDPNLLLLKATSAASLHCLNQCLSILQRNQHAQQSRTGLVIDDD